ncbi:hypothetical protein P168DRAFT_278055 [Aspergillus campestris IBT 28561]|uniref:Uncharacterized protein n=1 Tax=Aspergillus campestris (strain IBT 28561) TaxID=1392248 RepID=A0A2I1DF11_ASPC2|nr:uncharacterized protein P168DRAFT_278055 [Aspergillus campestris IBT 28561]PKY08469.1 hypothetical protein P168DRAFT_278055 [Aspergillus campestris IBT 28561]
MAYRVLLRAHPTTPLDSNSTYYRWMFFVHGLKSGGLKVSQPIQGTDIPYFYGKAVYDGSMALNFLAIAGRHLYYLARNKLPESENEALQQSLEDALETLTPYGVEYDAGEKAWQGQTASDHRRPRTGQF